MTGLEERLILAWWNTGISPFGKTRESNESNIAYASRVVNTLLKDLRVDFLGLCEVTKSDLIRLLRESVLPNYSIYDGTYDIGRSKFDTGAIYNTDRFTLIDDKVITVSLGNRTLKLANRIEFKVANDDFPFYIFLTHWPSHLTPDSESFRILLGARLRLMLSDLITVYKENARLIIMGDFNEEPFHECIENQLLATRDRDMAKKSYSYLYNPFWRLLGESVSYTHDCRIRSYAGTCHISSGHSTKWKTVDQIIVSSAFLGNCSWHLNEDLTKILYITPNAIDINEATGTFDHFPIITAFDLISQ